MKTLFGYADAISLRAGGTIAFKVSSESGAAYEAQIVRLISGDTNPAGPGYDEQEVAGAAWACPGRKQLVCAGSCLAVPRAPVLDGFALQLLAWPTTPGKPGQVLASCWDEARQAGFILSLEGADGLCLRLGDGQGGAARLALVQPVLERHWYRIHASYDRAEQLVELRQEPLAAQVSPLDRGGLSESVQLGTIGTPDAQLVFAARAGSGGFTGFYNGKLEAPRLSQGDDVLGAWDFAQDVPMDRVTDTSGGKRHGMLHQMPARGMTGHNWRGTARHWREAPAEYGAIHFHDDDLDDAAWETDFTYAVPVHLPSGLYAARLTSPQDEDHIPFVVRPGLHKDMAKLAFLVPTASYLAYANEHMALDYAFAERVHDHVPVFGPNDMAMAAHRELGNSLYDRHSDGSPVFCSSRRRPILNMRPKYQSWLGGGRGSGLWQLNADTHLLAWLEHENIAFDCLTDEDLDREGAAALAGYRCLMTGTHPEYWSTAMRDGLDGFRAAGGRTMYMGGNGLYWRIAYHDSGSGTIEVRRGESGTAPGEMHHAFNGEHGGLWRRIGRPSNQAVGVGFAGQGFDICSYFRRLPASFAPRAAFIFNGVPEEIIGDFGLIGGGAAGIELDRTDPLQGTPVHALVLARSEHHTNTYLASLETLPINCLGQDRMHPIFAEMVFYETPEKGAVFDRFHRLGGQPGALRFLKLRGAHIEQRSAPVPGSGAVHLRGKNLMDGNNFPPGLGQTAAAFVAGPHLNLVGANWVPSLSGDTLPVIDPGTGAHITTIQASDAADVDRAVAAARAALEQGPWRRMNASDRGRLVYQLARRLGDAADELAELESLDTGRPLYECQIVDVPGSVNMLEYMAGWANKINGETMDLGAPGELHAYTVREAVGVVAVIVPWNYPLELAVWRMAPALAAGCTVVLKPAENTSLTALRLGQLVLDAGFPPGVVNVVTGFGETAGAALAVHPGVDAISFTGSTETGKAVLHAAAGNLKRVFLELGGKSPCIVLADADLESTIAGVAGSIFFSSGQVCTAGSRLFVDERVFDRVVDGVARIAEGLKVGHGLSPGTQLGPLVSDIQRDRVMHYLDGGRRDGAYFVTGGSRLGERGFFVAPTVVTQTTPKMPIYSEEVFGPVLCAVPFKADDLDGAAAAANDTIYGLHASIWTQNLRHAHQLARRIKSGNVCINTHNFFDPAFPMGGYKQSGWGRAAGFAAIEHYTEVKGIVARL